MSFMVMKAKDHRESPIHVECSHDLTSTLIVFKPQCQEDLIGLPSGTESQETMQTTQIIESGVMATDLPPEILNGALPHKMDIVTELWYEPEAAPPTPGTASASASGIRRPREPEPHGEKREHEEQHEPAGSPTAKARVDRDKKRKAEGEREDEAERARDIQSIEMALESLILEDRERERECYLASTQRNQCVKRRSHCQKKWQKRQKTGGTMMTSVEKSFYLRR